MTEPTHSGSEPTTDGRQQVDYRALFDIAPIGLAILDSELRYVRVNRTLCEMNGLAAEQHIGKSVQDLLPEIATEVVEPFLTALKTGVPRHDLKIVGETPKAPGLVRTWLESIEPLRDSSGHVQHILVAVQEITQLVTAENALIETERVLNASHQVSPDAFTILRAIRDDEGQVRDFEWVYANPAAVSLLGGVPLIGRRLLDQLPGNRDHPLLFPRYVRLLQEGGPEAVEVHYEHDGVTGWFRNAAFAIDGEQLAISFRDISGRKRTEAQLELATQELRHRVKNMIAIVDAFVRHTARSAHDVAQYQDALGKRLSALALAQDLLFESSNGGVALDHLVREALRPFEMDRLQIQGGPELQIPSEYTQGLVLALNELATNALKYGALSEGGGEASVRWSTRKGRLKIVWHESGVPAFDPAHHGFGTRLLSQIAAGLPGGEVTRKHESCCLTVKLSFLNSRRDDASEVN